jgi:16S rRNA processing protein RimM
LPTDETGEPVLVGVVARPHGLGGEVVVDVYSDAPGRFAPGMSMTARPPSGAPRTVKVANARPFNARLLVRFEGCASKDEAQALHGAELTVAKEDIAPLPAGTHYRFQLLGLRVRGRDGKHYGEVADVFATGSNDVYVIRGPEGELLLPALESVVLKIDLERKEMVVEVPPGLTE